MYRFMAGTYKTFRYYTPYIPLFNSYPLLFPMPGVPLGPQHLSHNALHPPDKEFVPPAAVADEYTAAEEQLSLLMACNYPQFVKQLGLFVRTAAVLVRRG
jgi:hypothetical protein